MNIAARERDLIAMEQAIDLVIDRMEEIGPRTHNDNEEPAAFFEIALCCLSQAKQNLRLTAKAINRADMLI